MGSFVPEPELRAGAPTQLRHLDLFRHLICISKSPFQSKNQISYSLTHCFTFLTEIFAFLACKFDYSSSLFQRVEIERQRGILEIWQINFGGYFVDRCGAHQVELRFHFWPVISILRLFRQKNEVKVNKENWLWIL